MLVEPVSQMARRRSAGIVGPGGRGRRASSIYAGPALRCGCRARIAGRRTSLIPPLRAVTLRRPLRIRSPSTRALPRSCVAGPPVTLRRPGIIRARILSLLSVELARLAVVELALAAVVLSSPAKVAPLPAIVAHAALPPSALEGAALAWILLRAALVARCVRPAGGTRKPRLSPTSAAPLALRQGRRKQQNQEGCSHCSCKRPHYGSTPSFRVGIPAHVLLPAPQAEWNRAFQQSGKSATCATGSSALAQPASHAVPQSLQTLFRTALQQFLSYCARKTGA